MSKSKLKVYEFKGGKFFADVPLGERQNAIAEHNLRTHTFVAHMRLIGVRETTVYFKDIDTFGIYPMSTTNFVEMVKNSVLVNGLISGKWGWSYHPTRTTIKLLEVCEE
ncbi:MAG: hypothetical protein E6R04_02270 [Spirochaetes bacterium]|nr:MAG: hypothetical protein E6R04_02270 [Spirochaetota bacterium]